MTHINVLLRQVAVNEEINGPWAGVDAGVLKLLEMNKQVTYAYGDFDSVNRSQLEKIRKAIDLDIVPSEKDYTDSELALLDLRDKGYKTIDVYGALGGRLDHELINIQLLNHPKLRDLSIHLRNDKNDICLLTSGHHELLASQKQYVSFIPLYDETLISLEGFKYDIKDRYINIGDSLTVSNEFTEKTARLTTNQNILMINSTD